LDEQNVYDVFYQLMKTIHETHSLGIAHRDIKL